MSPFSRFIGIGSFLALLCLGVPVMGQEVEVKDNFFYLDGEKFFVKGIGYEAGAGPGELPWARTFDEEQLRFDITRILDAGFNTIRTWESFTDQELQVLSEFDIKIIMGIWIDPHGDFADPVFRQQSRDIVSDVLAYSVDYENIIGYLIMNEPLPEVIFSAGYAESVSLWQELMGIIHTAHPGRPASMANTSNGTYIDPDIFDFAVYNGYIYNPVTINFLHTYQTFVKSLRDSCEKDAPLVMSEFGLSVSPTGPGNWGYGGNSLEEQSEGIIHMYQSLVNGGAAGACVFNHSDGWWKGGNEFAHDDTVEEWFGLVEYESLDDQQGTPRPAWYAVSEYQSAIITEPHSGEVYLNKVPIEIFPSGEIVRAAVISGNDTLLQMAIDGQHIVDSIQFSTFGPIDQRLDFIFYDENDTVVKEESKSILVVSENLELPRVKVEVLNENIWSDGFIDVRYSAWNHPDFNITSDLYQIFYPHVGFNYGTSFGSPFTTGDTVVIEHTFVLEPNVNAVTVGASFDVLYNNFKMRVVGEQILSRADSVTVSVDLVQTVDQSLTVYPNPASDFLYLEQNESVPGRYEIHDLNGRTVQAGRLSPDSRIDVARLLPGAYVLVCFELMTGRTITGKFIKG